MAKATVLVSNKKLAKVIKTNNECKYEVIYTDPFDMKVNPYGDKRFSDVIDACKAYMSKIIYSPPINSILIYDVPFKVRIKNITVPGYTPSDVPPIGIAIIGFNNYIL